MSSFRNVLLVGSIACFSAATPALAQLPTNPSGPIVNDSAMIYTGKMYISAGSIDPTTMIAGTRADSIASGVVQSRTWQSLIPFWGPVAASYNNNSVMTYGADFSVEGPYTAVQLILANRGTTAITLPNLAVAPSAQMTDTVTPHDASGNAVPFTAVTCNGGATCALAPSASATREQITLSDVIPLTSLPRTDGGAYPLVFTRVAMPANTAYTAGVVLAANITAYNQISGVRPFAAYYAGGDFVSSTAAQGLLTTNNAALGPDYNVVVGVRYLSPARIDTVMGCGDSLTAGFQTTSGYDGFGLQASIALSASHGVGVSYVAHGFPGTIDTDYLTDCAQAVSLLQPQIVTIPSDSPNNLTLNAPGTAATAASFISMPANALGMVNTALANNVLPVIETPIPFGAYDTTANYGIGRQKIGTIIRAANQRNVPVLDIQSIISGFVPTPTRLQALPAQYAAPDNAHINDAGHGLIAQSLAALLGSRL